MRGGGIRRDPGLVFLLFWSPSVSILGLVGQISRFPPDNSAGPCILPDTPSVRELVPEQLAEYNLAQNVVGGGRGSGPIRDRCHSDGLEHCVGIE